MAVVLFLLIVAGCEHAGPLEIEPTGPNFTDIQAAVFNQHCALSGCHAGSNPPHGLNLSEGLAYGNLVGFPSAERPELKRIDPGNPGSSYLLKKIRGDADIVGARMPFGRAPLSDSLIELIRTWIEDGAPEGSPSASVAR